MVPFMALATNPNLMMEEGRLQQLYQSLGSPDRQSFLISLGLLVMGALSLSNLLAAATMALGLRFSHRQQKRLSLRLLQTYLSRDYTWHLNQQHLSLSHRVSQARSLVESNFQPLLIVLTRVFHVIFLLLALLLFSPLLTLAGLFLVVGLYASVYLVYRRRVLRAGERDWSLGLAMGRTLDEPLGGLKETRLANRELHYLQLYARQLEEGAEIHRDRQLATEVPRLVMHTLTYGALLGLVILLVSRYGGGTEVVGRAALFALAGYRLVPGVQQIFTSLAWFEGGRPILDHIHDDLQIEPAPLVSVSETLTIERSLALQGVSFSYGEQPLFRNLSLTVEARRSIGLVGTTGSGKTTLMHLLAGLLQPQSGHLLVDGQPLDELQRRCLGRSIGYVPQDIYLSDDSVFANIALGQDSVDEEAALRAAQIAQVDEFARQLPYGYHTPIGERGVRLSGGQRQRIALARALYHNPSVLLLDEATSALDGETEERVMRSIETLAGAKTIVMVAHRLTTLRNCDRIYVLGEGGILQEGSYAELSQPNPTLQGASPSQ